MILGSEKIKHFHPPEATLPQRPQQEGRISSLLDVFLSQQIDAYLGLGFHRELDQNEEEYRRSFPKPLFQEEVDRGMTLVAVDPRIPVKIQQQRAGIYERSTEAINATDKIKAPTDRPYLILVRNGTAIFNSITETAVGLPEDEVDCTWQQLVTFYLLHYQIYPEPSLVLRSFSAAGSRFRTELGELVPFLDMYADKPVARGILTGSFYPHRVLSRLKKINIAT